MQKKIIALLTAAVLGCGAGALVGYGPLLRYKSEGILNIDMGTSEYKRFTELANDSRFINQFLKNNPLPTSAADLNDFMKTMAKGEWHKPIPKVNKSDAKELTDAVLQMERENDKESLRGKNGKQGTVYLGVKLNYIHSEPVIAAAITEWLGNYFKEVATREALREQLSRWSADNMQFSDRATEQKLRYEFEIEQAKTRVASLKKITTQYPDISSRLTSQVVDVRKDNEKFISPIAQLVGSESEIIDITEKIKKLNREMEQQKFAIEVLEKASDVIKQTNSGTESVSKLAKVFVDSSSKIKSDAEKEKLLSFTAELSQISARFLAQAQFITHPSVPTSPERPTPLLSMLFMGILFVSATAFFVWRKSIISFLSQNTDN